MTPRRDAVIRRAATRAMVLLKNDGPLLPLAGDVRRVALIGPHARYGRVQGGGSARVRPVHRPGPLDALTSRGFDVVVRARRVIDKFLPTIHGEFTVELADGERERRRRRPTGCRGAADQSPGRRRRRRAADHPDHRRLHARRDGRRGSSGCGPSAR